MHSIRFVDVNSLDELSFWTMWTSLHSTCSRGTFFLYLLCLVHVMVACVTCKGCGDTFIHNFIWLYHESHFKSSEHRFKVVEEKSSVLSILCLVLIEGNKCMCTRVVAVHIDGQETVLGLLPQYSM